MNVDELRRRAMAIEPGYMMNVSRTHLLAMLDVIDAARAVGRMIDDHGDEPKVWNRLWDALAKLDATP